MQSFKRYANQINNAISKLTIPVLHNDYVFPFIHLTILFYAVQVAPKLPQSVLKTMDNFFFKMFFMIVILLTARVNPLTAIFVTIAFLVTMNLVNHGKLIDFLDNVDSELATQGAVLQTSGDIMETPILEQTFKPLSDESYETPSPSGDIFSKLSSTEETHPDPESEDALSVSGCLPHRKTDMSKVMGMNDHGISGHSNVDF